MPARPICASLRLALILLGAVNADRTISFSFHELEEGLVLAYVLRRFGLPLVHECFTGNRQ